MLDENPTFYRVFQNDWTKNVMSDLSYKLNGKIPRNFVVNIGGLVGNKSGIFKSTLGLQIAMALDPFFTLQQRVSFSINNLLDKVRDNSEYFLCNKCYWDFKNNFYGSYEEQDKSSDQKCDNCDNVADKLILLCKMIFFLDEQTKTLKTGGIARLQNLVDTCRQRQICFISCGVDEYGMNFTTYNLKRLQESSDDLLPKKRVRYAVFDNERDIYYGFFQWDITPLTDVGWMHVFDEYSKMKTDFQRVAISQQIDSMNVEDYAQEVINSQDFMKCFKQLRDGRKVLQNSIVLSLIVKHFPNLTEREQKNILSEIRMELYDDDEEEA